MVGSGVQSPYTIPGRKAGELGRESLAQRTGNREWGGGSVVNETYQYTTRTASAIAPDRIPAQREDTTYEQRRPRGLRLGPCAQPYCLKRWSKPSVRRGGGDESG